MRGLVGALILGGAALQLAAHFVRDSGTAIWDYNHESFRAFVLTADYSIGAILLAVAGAAVLASASRAFAAFAAGIAVMSATTWVDLGFQEWIYNYGGSESVAWSGLLGLLGAIVAGVGAVIGWTVGFETQRVMTAAPGWYADPSGQGQRWWDGTAWTTHTAP